MNNWFGQQWIGSEITNSKASLLISPDQTHEKTKELASCQISYSILFNAISPLIGYGYTGRFKALGLFVGSSLIVLVALLQAGDTLNLNKKTVRLVLGIGTATVAAADNSRAILAARKQLAEE
ncbi:MAG: hypothetical protein AAFR58_22180 [Cyanobacteria bacterium J06627_28]